nr:rRNA maturation RNase YbeY [candidate division Zixibacteria bacterium]
MHVNIISDTNRRIPRQQIRWLIESIDEEEAPPDSTVNIIFTRDKEITRLNRDYRSKRGPTDVLSFNLDSGPGDNSIFGEIYISTDTAARNAHRDGRGFYLELLALCCHGYLHLLGYDHELESERDRMSAREKYHLERIA